MICRQCKGEKLSKEFPHEPLTEQCDHPLLHCFRCVTASVRDSRKCSQCPIAVPEDNAQYQEYVETLEFLFPKVAEAEYDTGSTRDFSQPADWGNSAIISITTLSGECTTLSYNPNQTIQDVKNVIAEDMEISCDKQCLLYGEAELKSKNQHGGLLSLKDYNVPPYSTLYLLVMLYAVPEGLDHVIFDLFWGYPASGKDYLDASVLLFSGSEFVEVVDWTHNVSESCASAVRHSGDVMDRKNRKGHHTINVSIKSLPSHIDKLVFTLSAWKRPNISEYPNPSLRFFDAEFPDKQLCSDEMSHAAYSQAIIMCCLSKRGGQWEVFSLKKTSDGNARNYGPLKSKIVNLIKKRYI